VNPNKCGTTSPGSLCLRAGEAPGPYKANQQAEISKSVGHLMKSFWEEFEEHFFQKEFLKVLTQNNNYINQKPS